MKEMRLFFNTHPLPHFPSALCPRVVEIFKQRQSTRGMITFSENVRILLLLIA
jgi:hypothetical protein